MRKFLFLFLGYCLTLSCTDRDDNLSACGVDNPKTGLSWLKEEIQRRESSDSDDIKYWYIVQAELDGNTVFIYKDCNPAINKAIFVYNCEGENIGTVGVDISDDELKNSCVIWRAKDFVCLIDFACIRE